MIKILCKYCILHFILLTFFISEVYPQSLKNHNNLLESCFYSPISSIINKLKDNRTFFPQDDRFITDGLLGVYFDSIHTWHYSHYSKFSNEIEQSVSGIYAYPNYQLTKLELKGNNNLNNFPFQFGFEVGKTIRIFKEDPYIKIGFNGYVDLNIYDKIFFLKLELGRMNLNDEIELKGEDYSRDATYSSFGLNWIFLRPQKSRFSIYIGLTILSGGFLPVFSSSLRYVYIMSKYFAITTAIKYPITNGDNLYLTLGVQFFNN